MELHLAPVAPGETTAEQSIVGTDIHKHASLCQEGVRQSEKFSLKIPIDHDEAQETIIHIGVTKRVIPDSYKLKRILARKSHPGLHQAVPAHRARQALEQS